MLSTKCEYEMDKDMDKEHSDEYMYEDRHTSTCTRNIVTSAWTMQYKSCGHPNSERQRTSKRSAQYNEQSEAVRSDINKPDET
jgi:hypothetical protein